MAPHILHKVLKCVPGYIWPEYLGVQISAKAHLNFSLVRRQVGYRQPRCLDPKDLSFQSREFADFCHWNPLAASYWPKNENQKEKTKGTKAESVIIQ